MYPGWPPTGGLPSGAGAWARQPSADGARAAHRHAGALERPAVHRLRRLRRQHRAHRDLVAWDPVTNTVAEEMTFATEAVALYRPINDALYAPAIDPRGAGLTVYAPGSPAVPPGPASSRSRSRTPSTWPRWMARISGWWARRHRRGGVAQPGRRRALDRGQPREQRARTVFALLLRGGAGRQAVRAGQSRRERPVPGVRRDQLGGRAQPAAPGRPGLEPASVSAAS